MLHDWLAAGPGDPDDVKARVALLQSPHRQKELRRPNDFPLLPKFDRFERCAKAVAGARLHFDKDDDSLIENDQVKLSSSTAIIALDELVAFLLQIPLGQTLALFPQQQFAVIRGHHSNRGPIFLGSMLTSRTGLKLCRWTGQAPKRLSASKCATQL